MTETAATPVRQGLNGWVEALLYNLAIALMSLAYAVAIRSGAHVTTFIFYSMTIGALGLLCVKGLGRDALQIAASRAARELGYTRMWSIHPDQIRPILAAFAPSDGEVQQAAAVLSCAVAADWAPVSVEGRLHARASYRFYWQVLVRAHQTGHALPDTVAHWFQSFTAEPALH